ncbi:MAG: ATP-binding cassette domain-containing protein [Aggregatilineales bacterium]
MENPAKASSRLALDLKNVSKRYGETQALTALDLQCKLGTVHTVFGENGSGKSTLVKVLSGIIAPDQGEVWINGVRAYDFNPGGMRRMGIAPVLQEVLVAPNRSVLENIFMGYDGLFSRRIERHARIKVARQILSQLSKTPIPSEQLVEKLPLPQQQIVVIARALVRNPRILILDEATGTLDIDDRETLFNTVREFVSDGRLVIFISHRIDEVLEISDAVTVLKNGKLVTTVPCVGLTAKDLLSLILPETVSVESLHV